MKMNRMLTASAVLLTLSSVASAQFELTSRYSKVNYDYFAGFANQSESVSDFLVETTLDVTDSTALVGSEDSSGFYVPSGTAWSANGSWNIGHQYSLIGSAASATKLTASGSSTVSITSSNATAQVASSLPGSEFSIEIALNSAQQVRFMGSHTADGPLNQTTGNTFGYFWNGSTWQIFLVKQVNTNWDDLLNLGAGTYRFETFSIAQANQNATKSSSWEYSIEAVPEPGTMIALGIGALAVAARKRNKN
jgi:hypothetical protein